MASFAPAKKADSLKVLKVPRASTSAVYSELRRTQQREIEPLSYRFHLFNILINRVKLEVSSRRSEV